MTSKLSLHIIIPSPEIDQLIRAADWRAVKAVGNPSPLAVAAAAGVPIRIFRQVGVEAMDPAGAVVAITAHDLSNVTHMQIVCEDAKGYDPAWQLAVMDGLRASGYGARFLVCASSTGNPPKITGDPPHFPELEPIYPLLRRSDVDLALDAYTGLLIFDPRWAAWAPYTVYRPSLIHADLLRQGINVNIIVTESGGDNIAPVTVGGGWQSRNWSADEYLTTLRAVDADDQTHPWLLARCLFTSGPTDDWRAFDVEPIAAQLAAYVGSQATTPQNAPLPPAGDTGAAATPLPPASTPKGAPVASLPIPMKNQLAGAGQNRYNECACACIRMVCDYLSLDAGESIDQIDVDETGSEQYVGYTTTNQMVQWFADRGIPAVQSQPLDVAAAIVANLARGWPCIYLGVWDRSAMTGGHFEVPIASDGASVTFNNPYGGFVETLAYTDVNRYSLGWLVTVQQTVPEVLTVEDPIITAARNRWSAANAAIKPLEVGALFHVYTRMIRNWVQNGQDNVLDPTPAIRNEWTASDGSIARVPLDNGLVLEWHRSDGLVYQVEAKDHDRVWKECGW